jgi:phytoene desaturase
MSKRVVIVGAGPGGLATAMLLGKAGADVTVLEKEPQVGGRTSSIKAEGYTFDVGPTFFLYPPVIEEIYAHCGWNLYDEVEMIKLDPHYRLYFEGRGNLEMNADLEHMESEIGKFSVEDGRRFKKFMDDNRRKFRAFKPILERPFSSALDLANPRYMSVLPLLRIRESVESDLRRHFSDEDIRLACAFQSKYLGMSPFTCPSLFTILSFLEYEYGITHPKGGCAQVSRDMAAKAESLGVKIHLAEPVREISFAGKRATGAVTDKGEYACDALVINEDFAYAMDELVPDSLRRRWKSEKLARKKYSCSTFMLYLGVDGSFPQLAHHNIFLSADYKQNLQDIESNHQLSDNPSFYVCNPSLADPSMAPAGKTALYVLVPVTHLHPNVDWAQEKQRYRELVMEQLKKVGIELDPARIEYEKVVTPEDWSKDYSVYKGAVFNLAHSLDQMLHLRPHNRFEELESVYLTGGGTHPGSGLPVIYESARISAGLISRDLGLMNECAC